MGMPKKFWSVLEMQAASARFKSKVRSRDAGSSHGQVLPRQSKMPIAIIKQARFLREP
ncbi:hypothetical protein [Nevskia ramosa]|uniref:hypothetical protein n=1 Tax=Nevskia ramosa TaxID=64002 RepID=UPI0023535CA7|nr:hypothetical protein [Nevskia ramosa]